MLTIWISPSSNCQRNSFYVKDISDFLQKINAVEFVPHNSYLISLELLYTSIPNAGDIKAVNKFLENYPKRTVAAKVITAFSVLILALNSFVFNSTSNLQTKGCAMRTICAPSNVNVLIDHFEKKALYSYLKGFHQMVLISLSQSYWWDIFYMDWQ